MSINYLNGSAFPETISQDPSVNIQVHPNLEVSTQPSAISNYST
jgi:hypothetical protein